MEYFADLHMHSEESFDSFSEPLDILGAAKAKGLNLIAVTDHGTIIGGLMTREKSLLNPSFNVFVIVGAEITTLSGDIIGLFLSEEIRSKDPFAVIEEIKHQNGISIYAHPYRKAVPDIDVLKAVDAVEIYNCRCTVRENLQAQNSAFKYGKPGIASSDAHKLKEIGKAYTVIELSKDDEPLNASNFLKAEIRPVIESSK